jgi:hypothetical protein
MVIADEEFLTPVRDLNRKITIPKGIPREKNIHATFSDSKLKKAISKTSETFDSVLSKIRQGNQ